MDRDLLFREWIFVGQRDGAQGDGKFIQSGSLAAVQPVPQDREAGGREVEPDLMGASGERFDQEQRFACGFFEETEVSETWFTFAFIDPHFAAHRWIFPDWKFTAPFILGGFALDNGEILFARRSSLEKFRIRAHGSRTFDEKQEPRGLGIEAVDEFKETQVPRSSPKLAAINGGVDGALEITRGTLPA